MRQATTSFMQVLIHCPLLFSGSEAGRSEGRSQQSASMVSKKRGRSRIQKHDHAAAEALCHAGAQSSAIVCEDWVERTPVPRHAAACPHNTRARSSKPQSDLPDGFKRLTAQGAGDCLPSSISLGMLDCHKWAIRYQDQAVPLQLAGGCLC